MRKLTYIIIAMTFSLMSFSQVKDLPAGSNFYNFLNGYYSQKNPDIETSKQIERMQIKYVSKLSPSGDCSIAADAIKNYAQNYNLYISDTYNPGWSELGPVDNTNESGCNIGRIHSVRFDPAYNGTSNTTLYCSSSHGGLWRSEDDGMNWEIVNTDIGLPVNSVSDIAVHPTNSNIIFVSTGVADEGIVSYTTRASLLNPVFTIGVYRSVDYGDTWEAINSGIFENLIGSATIRRMIINPNNPNQLFIATSQGIFRTNNANSADPQWELVFTGIGDYFDNEFKGLCFKPGDSNTIFASGQDIYKSTDGGNNWTSITGITVNLDLSNLFNPPDNVVDRINIAVSPVDPNRIWAYIISERYGYYIYMFNGNQWTVKYNITNPDAGITVTRPGLAVSPVDADVVYYGYRKLYHTLDGNSFSSNHYGGIHADIHGLEFAPNMPNPKLFCGSDGGVSVRETPAVSGSWLARNNGLGVSTLWTFDDTDYDEGWIIAGFQDCYTKRIYNGVWENVINCCDGFGAQINDANPNIMYFRPNKHLKRYNYLTNTYTEECNNVTKGDVQFTDYRPWDPVGTDQRSWLLPDFEIKNDVKTGDMYWTFTEINKRLKDIPDPEDEDEPDNLWELSSNIHEFEPTQWRRQINRFEISESNPDYRYIIRSGGFSLEGNWEPPLKTFLYKVEDGSNNYIEINRPGQDDENTPLVSDIVVDPVDPERIWISFTGFNEDYRVYYSSDAGDSWENFDSNNKLPNLPVNAIIYQKGTNDILYIGTDAGVYVKNGPSADWEKYGDFPNVIVQDLKINYCAGKLRVATYGRGLWEGDILPFETDLPEIVIEDGEDILWDTDVKRGLRNNIRIEAGGQLTIKGEISMPREGKITINPGAKLIIDGGTLTNKCGGIWKGITVLGNPDLPQWNESNQGVLEIKNNAVIEHAECAVTVGTSGPRDEGGGIIKLNNVTFRDNEKAVYFYEYQNTIFGDIPYSNRSYVINSTFETTDYLANIGETPDAFISMWSVDGVTIRDNTFRNLNPEAYSYTIRGRGIRTWDANFYATFNTFENLYFGLFTEGTGELSALQLRDNSFNNNYTGCHFRSVENCNIHHNIFNLLSDYTSVGIFSTYSSGYAFEENDFYGADNETHYGIVNDRINDNNLSVYKNTFSNIKYPLSAYNSPDLIFECNELSGNSKYGLYFAGDAFWTQGTIDHPAGNKFLGTTDRYDIYSYNEPIAYFCDTVPGYNPYLPVTYNSNVSLVPVQPAYHNECLSHYGGGDPGMDSIIVIDDMINTKQTLLNEIVDGGDTEGTYQDVENAEPDEALKLRNMLLEKSPNLSDSVMINATTQENVLPGIMLTQVLSENPQAAKSNNVNTALNNRENQLPYYMRNEIDEGRNSISEKEELEIEIANLKRKRARILNEKIRYFINDTLQSSKDSLLQLLTNEHTVTGKYRLMSYYLSENDNVNAQNVFTSIQNDFDLTAKQQEEYDKMTILTNIQFNLIENNKSYFEVDNIQKQALYTLAEDNLSRAGAYARTIISLIDGTDYDYPIPEPEEGGDKGGNPDPIFYPETFAVYPNPANDYFIIEYALSEKESVKDISIALFDNAGTELMNFDVKTQANQFLAECEHLKAGIYWCRKFNKGKITEEEKVIIDRGGTALVSNRYSGSDKSSAYEIVNNNNNFKIYPNPAKDYFFITYNLKEIQTEDIIIQITDSKGVIVKEIKLDKNSNQSKISTSTWSKGVYNVSIITNDKVIETMKIVIK